MWITTLALGSWWQTGQWRDTATLAARTLNANPAPVGRRLRPGDATARWYALTWLADDALQRRDSAAAERWLLEAERIPEFPQKEAVLQASLGRLMLDGGRAREAAQRFAVALEAAPHDVPSRIGLGLALMRGGEAREAEQIFRRLTAERPRITLAWLGLASALLNQGRTGEAVSCCERALKLAPGDRSALALLDAARQAVEGPTELDR
jgi:predicted Zn-dependent protease